MTAITDPAAVRYAFHPECGSLTPVSPADREGWRRDPSVPPMIRCDGCPEPVPASDLVWSDTGEPLDAWLASLPSDVPAPLYWLNLAVSPGGLAAILGVALLAYTGRPMALLLGAISGLAAGWIFGPSLRVAFARQFGVPKDAAEEIAPALPWEGPGPSESERP